MRKIPFFKMNGSGNDFIIIDNRENIVAKEIGKLPVENFVQKTCARGVSVGADGLILIENDEKYDFRWKFFNNDGGEVEMCGNGSRCAARFAYLNQIAPLSMNFVTLAGAIHADITGKDTVKVQLTTPKDYKEIVNLSDVDLKGSFINTGVPHVVFFVDDVDSIDIKNIGAKVRYHNDFKPAGTNVNFAQIIDKDTIKIRTYERGVEDETLACGTGSTAAALVAALKGYTNTTVSVQTKSNNILKVYADIKDSKVEKVFLEGDAKLSYIGTMTEEAWSY